MRVAVALDERAQDERPDHDGDENDFLPGEPH